MSSDEIYLSSEDQIAIRYLTFYYLISQVVLDGIALTDGNLLPPLAFKATIKDPHSVKLQWQAADSDPG